MTSEITPRCGACGHPVEKIVHVEDASLRDKNLPQRPAAITADYKHKLPHPPCSCARFNMTELEIY